MKTLHSILAVGALVMLSGCASYYKASENGPRADLEIKNHSEHGGLLVLAYKNADCSGGQIFMSDSIDAGLGLRKPIDADRDFTALYGGNDGRTAGCEILGSFHARAGGKYRVEFELGGRGCALTVSEQLADGKRIPVAFQKKAHPKFALWNPTCQAVSQTASAP